MPGAPRQRLSPFRLRDWQAQHGNGARINLAGSGCAPQDLAGWAPEPRELRRLAARSTQEQLRELEAAIAQAYGLKPGQVAATQGASEADFLVALALAGPGTRVVVERPAYHALVEPPRVLGCDVVRLHRKAPGHAVSPEAVRAVLRGAGRGARLVSLARPHNPTGQRIPDADLAEMAATARGTGAVVLVDEVFAQATRDGDVPACVLDDAVVSVNSLTKCMGFGALHVGWVAGPEPLMRRVRTAKDLVRPDSPLPSIAYALRALEHRQRLLAATQQRRARNAAHAAPWLAGAVHAGFAGRLHDHGTTMAVRLPRGTRDVTYAQDLLQRTGVLVAPGSFIEMPGWIRVGLLAEPAAFRDGLAAIATVRG